MSFEHGDHKTMRKLQLSKKNILKKFLVGVCNNMILGVCNGQMGVCNKMILGVCNAQMGVCKKLILGVGNG